MIGRSLLSYFVALAFFATPASAQLRVEPLDPTLSDLVMIGPEAPDFNSELSKLFTAERISQLKAYLPYTVLVISRTKQPLRRLDVMFKVAEPGGGTKQLVARFSVHFLVKGAVGSIPMAATLYELRSSTHDLKVGSSGVFAPPGRPVTEPRAVSASVDLVIYWDGRVAGPDKAGGFAQVMPDLMAGLELCRRVLEIQQLAGDLATFLETESRGPVAEDESRATDSVPLVAAMFLGDTKRNEPSKVFGFCSNAVDSIPRVISSLHK